MKRSFTRRDFLAVSAKGVGAAVVSYSLMGCRISDDEDSKANQASFVHGIASGDPSHSAVILWTRFSPSSDAEIRSSRGGFLIFR